MAKLLGAADPSRRQEARLDRAMQSLGNGQWLIPPPPADHAERTAVREFLEEAPRSILTCTCPGCAHMREYLDELRAVVGR